MTTFGNLICIRTELKCGHCGGIAAKLGDSQPGYCDACGHPGFIGSRAWLVSDGALDRCTRADCQECSGRDGEAFATLLKLVTKTEQLLRGSTDTALTEVRAEMAMWTKARLQSIEHNMHFAAVAMPEIEQRVTAALDVLIAENSNA